MTCEAGFLKFHQIQASVCGGDGRRAWGLPTSITDEVECLVTSTRLFWISMAGWGASRG